jgi:hypothetical protein
MKAIIRFLLMLLLAAPAGTALAGGGGGGGGCTGGTNMSCGVSYSQNTGNCTGCTPANNNNNINPCCYANSDLDCNGTSDVTYSVENTSSFTYTIPAGVACPTTFNFTITTTANLQGACFNTSQTGVGGGLDGSSSGNDEHGSSAMGGGTFTLTSSGCAGQVIQVFIDGYAGETGSFSISVPCPVILPIELLSFTGVRRREDEAEFYWITATETNNHFFTLEESSDGVNFIPIAMQPGAGNSSQELHYKYTYKDPPHDKQYYYRLKQTDHNGDFSYSGIIVLEDAHEAQLGVTSIAPMPVKDIMTITLNTDSYEEISIRLFDVTGRMVYNKSFSANRGSNTIEMNLSGLENGVYFTSLTQGGESVQTKIFKH